MQGESATTTRQYTRTHTHYTSNLWSHTSSHSLVKGRIRGQLVPESMRHEPLLGRPCSWFKQQRNASTLPGSRGTGGHIETRCRDAVTIWLTSAQQDKQRSAQVSTHANEMSWVAHLAPVQAWQPNNNEESLSSRHSGLISEPWLSYAHLDRGQEQNKYFNRFTARSEQWRVIWKEQWMQPKQCHRYVLHSF